MAAERVLCFVKKKFDFSFFCGGVREREDKQIQHLFSPLYLFYVFNACDKHNTTHGERKRLSIGGKVIIL